MTLLTEIGDWRRFERPGQLMAYLGLVQAGWSYRSRPAISADLKRRQRGHPPEVVARAWKAQQNLYKLYHRIAAKKSSRIAVVAVARELTGFLWAVMCEIEDDQATLLSEAA